MRPRVCRIITRLNVGGPARQALHLTASLPERGFECELVTGIEGPHEGAITDPAVPRTLVPSLGRKIVIRSDLRAARALTHLLRRRAPHIVHTHMAKAGALGRVAASRTGVPVVVHTFHGHVLEGYFPRAVNSAFVLAERRLARRTDALVAVSTAIRDQLLGLGIGRAEQWRVIQVGLDLDALLGSSLDRVAARKRLGLPPNGALVGIVGRLVPIKDHATFFSAAARLAGSRTDVGFVVAGDGPLRGDLELTARERLGSRVTFLGWTKDLEALYSALAVVVLSSRNEGTPVSLIEASAASRPVVATRVGGVPDVVRDGDTGFVVPAADPVALADNVDRILDDPELGRALATAGRTWVRDRFGTERLTLDISRLYEELLERRGLAGRMPS